MSTEDSTSDSRYFQLDPQRKLVISTHLGIQKKPWVVYVPGSGDNLNPFHKNEYLKILENIDAFNFLIINKIGLELNGQVSSKDDFQHGSIRSQRIQDNLQVMREIVPFDAEIILVGLSEGAYIAPEIAKNDARVKSLILLSGNTWSWLEEEVNYLPPEKQPELRNFLETVVIPNPVFDRFYGEDNFWSYAYFDSYNTDLTYKTLAASNLPILAINGGSDKVLWLEGAIENMRKLTQDENKNNIEFHLIPNADHTLKCAKGDANCEPSVVSDALNSLLGDFVQRQLDR